MHTNRTCGTAGGILFSSDRYMKKYGIYQEKYRMSVPAMLSLMLLQLIALLIPV